MKVFDLHKHSHYSTFDAIPKPEDYAKYIANNPDEFTQALSISEHGTLQGFVDTFNQAKKYGLKYVPSVEFYFQREYESLAPVYHLIAFATNEAGYYELISINNEAVKRSKITKFKVIVTLQELEKAKHISIAGACLQGYWNEPIRRGDLETSLKRAKELFSLFGKDRCFFELQTFIGKEQVEVNNSNIYFAEKLGGKLIVTSDAHVIEERQCKYINVNRAMKFSQTLREYEAKCGKEIHNTYLKTYDNYTRELNFEKKYLTESLVNLNCIADNVESFDINKKQYF
jgi:DNA polymerase-3 subunit alpha